MPFSTFYRLPEEKQKCIMDAALDEFIAYKEDYPKSSIKRIAKKAGVSIGSMYQYFKDKDELFFYLCERYTQAPSSITEDDTLNSISKKQTEYIFSLPERCTHNDLNEIIRNNINVLFYSLLYEHLMDSPLYQKIKSYLEKDQVRGLLREGVDLDVAAYLYLSSDILGYYLNATTDAHRKNGADDLSMQLVDIIFHGIYKKEN